MFTKLSSRSRRIFSALVVFLLVLTAGSFTSCKFIDAFKEAQKELEDMTKSTIYRNWESSYGEVFEITKKTLKNLYKGSVIYAGNELTVSKIDDTSGYIYIKYTENAFDSSVIGGWYAIYYKDLTPVSVSLAGAYGAKSSCETLEECKNEMTVENGYFAGYSECVKQ